MHHGQSIVSQSFRLFLVCTVLLSSTLHNRVKNNPFNLQICFDDKQNFRLLTLRFFGLVLIDEQTERWPLDGRVATAHISTTHLQNDVPCVMKLALRDSRCETL
jgi:hypothetical protein